MHLKLKAAAPAMPQLLHLLMRVLTALAALGWSLYALITEEA